MPVVWSHEVTFPLKYGVAPSGLPMTEMKRPTGVQVGFVDGGGPWNDPTTSWPGATLQTESPMIPLCLRCLAFNRTLLTYGDGRAHVERTSGPPNVIEPGV